MMIASILSIAWACHNLIKRNVSAVDKANCISTNQLDWSLFRIIGALRSGVVAVKRGKGFF